jgi:hypothetical protein
LLQPALHCLNSKTQAGIYMQSLLVFKIYREGLVVEIASYLRSSHLHGNSIFLPCRLFLNWMCVNLWHYHKQIESNMQRSKWAEVTLIQDGVPKVAHPPIQSHVLPKASFFFSPISSHSSDSMDSRFQIYHHYPMYIWHGLAPIHPTHEVLLNCSL